MFARLAFAVCVLGLLTVSGCGPAKLDQKQTISLDVGEAKAVDLTGQTKAQKINIKYSSPADVTVYVYKSGDEQLDDPEKNKSKVLTPVKQGKGETFSLDVPAKTPLRIIFTANKKTDVNVEINNKK